MFGSGGKKRSSSSIVGDTIGITDPLASSKETQKIVGSTRISNAEIMDAVAPGKKSEERKRDMADPVKRRDYIEQLPSLIRPYGCGPVAPGNWFVLKTYQLLLETRDETRMGPRGVVIGDQAFSRAYKRVHLTNNTKDIEKSFCEIFHCPFWHLWLLPFGVMLWTDMPGTNMYADLWDLQEAFRTGGKSNKARNNSTRISPYSVTCADVLYMCCTNGYLERYINLLVIILWGKSVKNIDLLDFKGGSSKAPSKHVRYERLLYLFGSIQQHIQVMEDNKHDVGGNWSSTIDTLESIQGRLLTAYNVAHNKPRIEQLCNLYIMKTNDSAGCGDLKTHFPDASSVKV